MTRKEKEMYGEDDTVKRPKGHNKLRVTLKYT